MLYKKIIFINLSVFFILSGCTNVEPWEREILAQNCMKLIPNPLLTAFNDHTNFSREATQGGYSIQGGGCGCN